MARQNIALRGHRDSINASQTTPTADLRGNFKALWIDSGDAVFEQHIADSFHNASYISPKIQRDIIECMVMSLKEKIVSQVQESRIYSNLADEMADI